MTASLTQTPMPMPDAPAAGPPDARDWQATLVALLVRLEELRAAMAGRRLGPDAARLLDAAGAMLAACDDVSREVPPGPALAAGQTTAVAKAGAYYSAAMTARPPVSRSAVLSALATVCGSGPRANPADVRDALLVAADALHHYFVLFTDQFADSASARAWVQAAAAFLTGLRQLVRELPDS